GWGFYAGPLILGGLGFFFCGFGALFLVLWRREGGEHSSSASWALPAPIAVAFLVLMTVMFVGGGLFGAYLVQHQRTSWRSVDAHVDSTDVVWQSSNSKSATLTCTPRVCG
ncbi:MAG: hypothetical protein ACR2OG_14735, partial [Gemmatimonadaceae bacterium]